MKLRLTSGAVVLAGVSIVLMACGAPAGPVTEPGIVREEMGPPQHGGTFHLSVLTQPTSLHPFSDTNLPTNITTAAIYEPLVRYDFTGDFREEYKLTPLLAERWDRTDPTTYLFHLRKGVKFHPSTSSAQASSEMTAQDVAWSLEYLRDPANKFRRAAELVEVDRIEAVDPATVRVTSKAPSATFLSGFTPYTFIFPKAAYDRGVDFEKEAIGTGPFKVVSWNRQAGATLAKHDGYWAQGKPYLDRVQLFYNFDAAGAMAAFSAGKNDVVKVSDKVQFEAIKAANPQARGESFPQNISDHLLPKIEGTPFADLRVRKAMHLALDRQEMVDTLTFGLGNANPPGMNGARKGGWAISQEELLKLPGYRQPKESDIAEARRLLAEAGHGGGLRAAFAYNSGFTRFPGEAQVVSAQLAKAGIQLTLDPKETAVARKMEQDGDYTMTFAQFDYDPEPDWSNWLHSKGGLAKSGIKDAELDRLIDEQYRELDETKRKKMWTDIQRLLLDKLYVIPLVTQVGFIAYQPYVHGWGDNRAGQAVNHTWDNTWLEVGKLPLGR